MVKQRDIRKINIPFSHFKITSEIHANLDNINGFDTETDVNGNMLCISDAFRKPLCCDYQSDDDFYDIIKFMMNRKYSKGHNFFWNIDFDISVITKKLPLQNLIELRKFKTTSIDYDNKYLIINYFNRKKFDLSFAFDEKLQDIDKNSVYSFWDIAPYFNHMKLANAAEFVGRDKMIVDEINELDYYQFYNNKKYQKMVCDRCFSDCVITKELAELSLTALDEIAPYDQFYSRAGNSLQLIMSNFPFNNLNEKGYIQRPSDKLNQFSMLSYSGGLFLQVQKGFFDNVHCYDLNSAYTSALINLKSFDGKTINSPNSMKLYDEKFNHLYLRVNLDIPKDIIFSPFPFRTKDNLFYLSGEFKDIWISKMEYDYYMKRGYITETKGFIGINDYEEKAFYMFKEIQLKLYEYKKAIKIRMNKDSYDTDKDKQYDKILYDMVKNILNSGYGITINVNSTKNLLDNEDMYNYVTNTLNISDDINIFKQLDGTLKYFRSEYMAGRMFAPSLGAQTTAYTRIKMYEAIEGNEDYLISCATDGLKFNKDVTKQIDIGLELGQWELENKKSLEGIGLASGQYVYYNDVDKIKIGSRGFTKGFDFRDMLKEYPDKLGFKIKKNSPIKTFSGINGTEQIFEINGREYKKTISKDNIGKFSITKKNFSLLEDRQKRNWDRDFINNTDVMTNNIQSKTLSIDDLKKDKNIRFDNFTIGLKRNKKR